MTKITSTQEREISAKRRQLARFDRRERWIAWLVIRFLPMRIWFASRGGENGIPVLEVDPSDNQWWSYPRLRGREVDDLLGAAKIVATWAQSHRFGVEIYTEMRSAGFMSLHVRDVNMLWITW